MDSKKQVNKSGEGRTNIK